MYHICKYVNERSDIVIFGAGNTITIINEIDQYQLRRYISSDEEVWRILTFPIHGQRPTVVYSTVHLENRQLVYFRAENMRARVLSPLPTTLITFLLLNGGDIFSGAPTFTKFRFRLAFPITINKAQVQFITSVWTKFKKSMLLIWSAVCDLI